MAIWIRSEEEVCFVWFIVGVGFLSCLLACVGVSRLIGFVCKSLCLMCWSRVDLLCECDARDVCVCACMYVCECDAREARDVCVCVCVSV
jgi:hypothetical protein